jgi:hypothetical protein
MVGAAGSALAMVVLTTMSTAPTLASAAGPSDTASSTSAAGSLGIRLLDIPMVTRSNPRAQVYIVDHLAPSTVIHRRIEISNTTSSAMHVVLYSAAATIANGTFLGAAGHTANALSTWTSVRPSTADLPSGGHAVAMVTVAVPRGALSGEQYGVVWAQVQSPPSKDGGVIQISRVGIRIYLSVGPGGALASGFAIRSLTAERSTDGQPKVIAAVHNSGGRALDMYGTLRLSGGPGGLSAGPFAASLGTTLGIGDTEPVTIVLNSQLPAGPWHAQLTLKSGPLSHSAQATITFPKTGGAPIVFATSPRAEQPYVVIVALVILLLLGAATVLVGSKRRLKT